VAEVTDTSSLLGPEELVEEGETEYDLLFPDLPVGDDIMPPDEWGGTDNLVDDIEEYGTEERGDEDEGEEDEDEDERTGADYAFDWAVGEFFADQSGAPLRVTGEQAIVEWALKALNTERGEYAIYSDDYGCRLNELLGSSLASPVLNAEIDRAVRECLRQHPRITDVEVETVGTDTLVEDAVFIDIAFWIDGDDEPITIGLSR
jgi:phage baseplate assembly protein W